MFEQILVPLDRSLLAECVLPHALALAQTLNARLVLLHVVARSEAQNGQRAVDPLEWHIRRAEAESYLQSIAKRVQDAGVGADIQVLDGDAAEQILAVAQPPTIGLIAFSSHGQSGLSGWNVSSVVQKVILRARTSILIVRAFQPTPTELTASAYRRLLVPLDSSMRAESVLPLTSVLLRAFPSKVLLAHVVQRPPMPRRTPLNAEDKELAERIVERNRTEAELYLNEVRSQLPVTTPGATVDTCLLIADHPGVALQELVERAEIDLVILSAHGYSGQVRWPYGSLVISFIAYGSTPLLIYQDASPEQIAPTPAELALEKTGRR